MSLIFFVLPSFTFYSDPNTAKIFVMSIDNGNEATEHLLYTRTFKIAFTSLNKK